MLNSIDATTKLPKKPLGDAKTLFDRLSSGNMADIDAFEERFGFQGLIELRHVMLDLITHPSLVSDRFAKSGDSGATARTSFNLPTARQSTSPTLSYSEYEQLLRSCFWQLNRYLYPILTREITYH